MQSLVDINRISTTAFFSTLSDLYEHSPWVAERAAASRPFATLDALHAAMVRVVAHATPDEQLSLIRAHPELAGREASEGSLTADSSSEQTRLGLTSLTKAELASLADLNRRYRERFGFPCIIALALHATRDSVVREFEQRLGNSREAEIANALEQIHHITRARLAKRIRE